MSTQLDYGQMGTAISKLYGDRTVFGDDALDNAVGRLLEALLELHNATAINLDTFPEVDAVARLIAPTDFGCCVVGSTDHAVRACRACGCTDDRACVDEAGPCWWVEADLCSTCRDKASE